MRSTKQAIREHCIASMVVLLIDFKPGDIGNYSAWSHMIGLNGQRKTRKLELLFMRIARYVILIQNRDRVSSMLHIYVRQSFYPMYVYPNVVRGPTITPPKPSLQPPPLHQSPVVLFSVISIITIHRVRLLDAAWKV